MAMNRLAAPTRAKRPRIGTKVRVGTDFSGLDVVVNVCKGCVKTQHVFSSDVDPKVRQYLAHNHAPQTVYPDVRTRSVAGMEPVDLYALGPPCQSFSSAGLRKGSSDDRGKLFAFGCEYIAHHKPSMILFENVSKIKNHKDVIGMINDTLTSLGYIVHSKVLNTMAFGCPQSRDRFYLVAILKSAMVHPFCFPPELRSPGISFMSLVPKLPDDTWSALPVQKKNGSDRLVKLVVGEINKVAEKGINPFVRPVCIDAGNSEKWSHHTVDHIMTLTRTHCMTFSHWCTTKGGFLNVDDYIRLQGLDAAWIDYKGAGLKSREVAGMLGNCMSGNVLEFLLPCVLHSGGFISSRHFKSLEERARAKWDGNAVHPLSTLCSREGAATTIGPCRKHQPKTNALVVCCQPDLVAILNCSAQLHSAVKERLMSSALKFRCWISTGAN